MNLPMKSVVIPIEEGSNSDWAVDHAIALYRQEPVRVYLLNVRRSFPQYVTRFISKQEMRAFHHENGMRALKPAADRLDARGVPHLDHVLIGRQKAARIVQFAREHRCRQIILPKRSGGALAEVILGSVGGQIRHLIGADEPCAICEVY